MITPPNEHQALKNAQAAKQDLEQMYGSRDLTDQQKKERRDFLKKFRFGIWSDQENARKSREVDAPKVTKTSLADRARYIA